MSMASTRTYELTSAFASMLLTHQQVYEYESITAQYF